MAVRWRGLPRIPFFFVLAHVAADETGKENTWQTTDMVFLTFNFFVLSIIETHRFMQGDEVDDALWDWIGQKEKKSPVTHWAAREKIRYT